MGKHDLNQIFYFAWALCCLVFGLIGVLLSWKLGPAGFPWAWVVGVRILTILLLLGAIVCCLLAAG